MTFVLTKWRRRILRIALICLVTASLFAGFLYARYPGFARDFVLQLRHANLADVADLYAYMMYYTDYFSRVTQNPKTGVYDMDEAFEESQEGFERGVLCYHVGRFEEAVEQIEREIQQRGESEKKLFWLGLAYQRLAEQNNCAVHCKHCDQAARFCSLPIVAVHQDVKPSRKAADTFEKLLNDYDAENGLYRWLLNFSYMTLGQYPDGVPEKYCIRGQFTDTFYGAEKEKAAAAFSQLTFRECAAEMQINTDDAGKGVAVEDFDRDGYLDIITGGTFQTVRHYRNDGGRRFLDVTEESGLGGLIQPFIITSADYDNDGWVDLFVLPAVPPFPAIAQRSRKIQRRHVFGRTARWAPCR